MADEDGGGGGGADAAELAFEASAASAAAAREAAVDALLRAGKAGEAARAALGEPPFASKTAATKERAAATVARALAAVSARGDAEALPFLDSLDGAAADALMKYLYRALARPEASGALLRMHGQLVERHGLGCVVRAIVDRKTA